MKKWIRLACAVLFSVAVFKLFPFHAILNGRGTLKTNSGDKGEKGVSILKMLEFDGMKWTEVGNECNKGNITFTKAILKFEANTAPIYVDIRRDGVSGDILKKGIFEPETVKTFLQQLKVHSDAVVIDVGSHAGEYTLIAAWFNHETVAIDVDNRNNLRLCRSILEGNYTKSVTVINNAISDDHAEIKMLDGGSIPENYAVKVNSQGISNSKEKIYKTIILDDIIFLVQNRKVMLKLDVEGFEANALKGGNKFFDSNNVVYVQMEWYKHKNQESGAEMVRFLGARGFVAYDIQIRRMLDIKKHRYWGHDVVWLRQNRS